MLQCNHHISSPSIVFPAHNHNLFHNHNHRHCISILPLAKPTCNLSVSAHRPEQWLAELADTAITVVQQGEGPIEITSSSSTIFSTTDDPSVLQVATSVLLTGAIGVLLFRSLRRRAKRAKEMKFRSSGVKKSLKDEALETLKVMGSSSIDVTAKSPPSSVQAFLGAVSAGVIALILYKFTTTVEAGLNRQAMSDSYSVRQITITVRTIINGLCYLATFVFGINSVGLFLYSCQLAFNTIMGGSEEAKTADQEQLSSMNNAESSSSEVDQNPDNNSP